MKQPQRTTSPVSDDRRRGRRKPPRDSVATQVAELSRCQLYHLDRTTAVKQRPIWATARMISGEVTPSVRQIVAANAHRAEQQPQLAQINDSAARAKEVWSKYAAHDVPHSEDVRRKQQTDLWCSEIMEHLISEAIPASLTGPAIARFVATASECTPSEKACYSNTKETPAPIVMRCN